MKIATVVGARPQFVKAAPVSRALQGRQSEVVIHTGQHYDPGLSQIFFDELGLPCPHYQLGVGSGSHGQQTGTMLSAIEQVLVQERPDWVLVYGDTNSTLAGAVAAVKLHIPVAHVEAGLRSFNRRMPEEINRVLTDHASSLLFAPTHAAVANLEREGITRGVHAVGDVMKDAVLLFIAQARQRSTVLEDLGLESGGYFLCTIHRAENTDDLTRLASILTALTQLDGTVLLPLHPRTRQALDRMGRFALAPRIRVIEPVGYLDMLRLVEEARMVLTDSGGLQKEALILGAPCVTLRDETEWVETVSAGWNRIAGTDATAILAAVSTPWRPADRSGLYGDGRTSERIVALIEQGERR